MLYVLILGGCNTDSENEAITNLTGDTPPDVSVQIDGEMYETKMGAYCWDSETTGSATCIDTAGAEALLEGEKPIAVEAGEVITFKMDYLPQPNSYYLTQVKGGTLTETALTNNQFKAPEEKGIYYYDYGAW